MIGRSREDRMLLQGRFLLLAAVVVDSRHARPCSDLQTGRDHRHPWHADQQLRRDDHRSGDRARLSRRQGQCRRRGVRHQDRQVRLPHRRFCRRCRTQRHHLGPQRARRRQWRRAIVGERRRLDHEGGRPQDPQDRRNVPDRRQAQGQRHGLRPRQRDRHRRQLQRRADLSERDLDRARPQDPRQAPGAAIGREPGALGLPRAERHILHRHPGARERPKQRHPGADRSEEGHHQAPRARGMPSAQPVDRLRHDDLPGLQLRPWAQQEARRRHGHLRHQERQDRRHARRAGWQWRLDRRPQARPLLSRRHQRRDDRRRHQDPRSWCRRCRPGTARARPPSISPPAASMSPRLPRTAPAAAASRCSHRRECHDEGAVSQHGRLCRSRAHRRGGAIAGSGAGRLGDQGADAGRSA